jgi:hypothetical protein
MGPRRAEAALDPYPTSRMIAILALASLAALAPQDAPPPLREGALPVEKSSTLKDDGQIWYVSGRQRIRSNVELKSLRAVRIVAQGEEAVIEVEGLLDLRAATGGFIHFENVVIEPMPGCKGLVLLNCYFQGGGLRTAREGPCKTDVLLHSSNFAERARLDLELLGGDFNMLSCSFREPVAFRGATEDEKSRNALKLHITNCQGRQPRGGRGGGAGRGGGEGGPQVGTPAPFGFAGGLKIEGVRTVMVRNCSVAGDESLFADCGDLVFDNNLAISKRVEFRSSTPKGFGGVTIATTDFDCDRLVLFQPKSLSAPQKVRLESCWFDGRLDEQRILAEIVEDATNNPESGVSASFFKIQEAPLGFGGRAPQ